MKTRRKLLLGVAGACLCLVAASTNQTPILRGLLQSDMNGGLFSITNLDTLLSKQFEGNGWGLTNLNYLNISNAPPAAVQPVVTPGQSIEVDTNSGPNYTVSVVGTLTNEVYASNVLSGGTLAAATIGAFTGDITTPGSSYATTLKNTGTAGTYTKTTFDAQGRETSGTTLSSGDLPADVAYTDVGNAFTKTNGFDSVYLTNAFVFKVQSWGGPTNSVDLNTLRQQYTITSGNCAITNFTSASATGYENSSVLSLTNSTGSDATVYVTASSYTADDGARSFVVTNKTQRKVSFNHDDMGYHGITRTFY